MLKKKRLNEHKNLKYNHIFFILLLNKLTNLYESLYLTVKTFLRENQRIVTRGIRSRHQDFLMLRERIPRLLVWNIFKRIYQKKSLF